MLAGFTVSNARAELATADPANHSIESTSDQATPTRASAPSAVDTSDEDYAARRREREDELNALAPPKVMVSGRMGLGFTAYTDYDSHPKVKPFVGIAGSATVAVSGRTRLGVTGYTDVGVKSKISECEGDDCPLSYLGYGVLVNHGIVLRRIVHLSLSVSLGWETYRYERDDRYEPGGPGAVLSNKGVYVAPGTAMDIWLLEIPRIGFGPYVELPYHGSNGRMGCNLGLELAVGY